jgi:hypothetical protein
MPACIFPVAAKHTVAFVFLIFVSRHKCQHNQRGNITYGTDAPSTSSEYSKEYVQHQIERRQPYKPVQQTAAADGSLDDKTTHRFVAASSCIQSITLES